MEQYTTIVMAICTIALTVITYFYLKETMRIAKIAEKQLSGNLIPIVVIEITKEEKTISSTSMEKRFSPLLPLTPTDIAYLRNVGNGPAIDVRYRISGFYLGGDERVEGQGGPLIVGANSRKRLDNTTPVRNLSVYIEYKDISGNYYRTEDVDGEIQHGKISKPQLRFGEKTNKTEHPPTSV